MPRTNYYFLGIAGQVMSGLAITLKGQGHQVSGVAIGAYPPATDSLKEAGIHYFESYDPDHVKPGMTVVLGKAIEADNSELKAAQKLGLSIVSFPKLLSQIRHGEKRIVVAGTHGKTTTTTLIAWILETAGKRPDFVIGMKSRNFNQSVRIEDNNVMVLEGDEYVASPLDDTSKFMYYHPDILIITSLEWDHPDVFSTFEAVKNRFRQLVDQMPGRGVIIACHDDPNVVNLLKNCHQQVIWYGLDSPGDWQAKEIVYGASQTNFTVYHHDQRLAEFQSPLAGAHNIKNALAALAAADQMRISFGVVAEALLSFLGSSRRFEVAGQVNDITVIDDYAHHPTEVAATLQAARSRYPNGKLWAFFVPHTYSRTAALLPEYGRAFAAADIVILGKLEAAREQGQPEIVSSEDVAAAVEAHGQHVHYVTDVAAARELLIQNAEPGDTIVCMSVSGADSIAQRLVAELAQKWT